MMSAMEDSTASQPSVSEPARTDATQTGGTEKPYGDHYHKPVIVKGIFKGPILPVWLRKRFRHTDAPAAR
jgi:hypothetical protein